jgi:hypothetical protein
MAAKNTLFMLRSSSIGAPRTRLSFHYGKLVAAEPGVEIIVRHGRRFVVRGLRRGMDDEIGALPLEEIANGLALANIHPIMLVGS